MKKIYTIALIAFISFSVQAKQKLGLYLVKGETYYQNYTLDGSIQQEVNGQKIDIKMSVTSKVSYFVEDKHPSFYDMKVMYESMSMQMSTPFGAAMNFSSESVDSTDIFSRIMKQLINKPFSLKMNTDGTVDEITGLENIFNGLLEGFPNVSEQQKAQVQSQLQQSFGQEAFKGNIEMITAIFPREAVDINSTWENEIELQSGMEAIIKNKFTLTELEKDYAVIKGASTFQTAEQDEFEQINNMPAKYNLSGEMISNLKIDSKTGWIMQADITQDISGQIEIGDNPAMPGGMNIPMRMENNMKITDK